MAPLSSWARALSSRICALVRGGNDIIIQERNHEWTRMDTNENAVVGSQRTGGGTFCEFLVIRVYSCSFVVQRSLKDQRGTFSHRPVFADFKTASQTYWVSKASRKVGEAGLPLATP